MHPRQCLPLLLWLVGAISSSATPTQNSGVLGAGEAWETPFHIVDSGIEGPTVLIVGGMHGNEPSGWRAAEQIRHWPIVAGKLIVIPRANVPGLNANTRNIPDQPEGAENLNRNFPAAETVATRVAPRGEIARALWKFAGKANPAWVLDLHEGFEFNLSHNPPAGKTKSVGSSVIYEGGNELDPLAERIVEAANATVTDPKKRFSLIRRGPVSTGLAQACIRVFGAEAMILETTYKGQPLSLRTRQHRAMVNVVLNHIGMIDRDCRDILTSADSNEELQIGAFDGAGTGPSQVDVWQLVDAASGMTLHHLGPEEMREEVLKQFDAVVFPGGSGSKQAADLKVEGREAVRAFVESGGGYLGICAGAYLCSANYSWSLDLVNSKALTGTVEVPGGGRKQLWYRGPGSKVSMELSSAGQALFEGIQPRVQVHYANGPIITPFQDPALEDYEVLAWFRSEVTRVKQQEGTMVDTPAIISGRFGKGRVISMSPHPEQTDGLHSMITDTIRSIAQ